MHCSWQLEITTCKNSGLSSFLHVFATFSMCGHVQRCTASATYYDNSIVQSKRLEGTQTLKACLLYSQLLRCHWMPQIQCIFATQTDCPECSWGIPVSGEQNIGCNNHSILQFSIGFYCSGRPTIEVEVRQWMSAYFSSQVGTNHLLSLWVCSSALLPITTLMQWVNKPWAWLFQLIFIRNSNCNCSCKRTVWVWDASAAFVLYNSKLFQNRMPNMGTLRRSKVAAFRQQKVKYYQWDHYVGGTFHELQGFKFGQ